MKHNVLGVLIDALDYAEATSRIVQHAIERRPYGVTALAVHGVMTGAADRVQRYRLNSLDMVTPDGQPVRWALNWMHGASLRDRVYGPTLMLCVCEEAASQGLPVYLFGSGQAVVHALADRLLERFPQLQIAGAEPSRFRQLEAGEKAALVGRIRESGARIVFVGLGCPRQEVFVFETREALGMPVIAVGAAFEYHSGFRREPSVWIQKAGLQWLHRLLQEPGRLWKRYLILNTAFAVRLGLQIAGISRPDPCDVTPPEQELSFG